MQHKILQVDCNSEHNKLSKFNIYKNEIKKAIFALIQQIVTITKLYRFLSTNVHIQFSLFQTTNYANILIPIHYIGITEIPDANGDKLIASWIIIL